MTRGKIRKIILITLGSIVLFCCLAYSAIYLMLQSPSMLNNVASVFGYEVSASTISFSPGLSGQIEDLRITDASSGHTVVVSNVTVKNSLDMLMTGHIDSLVLRNPKLTFKAGGKTNLAFLNKLPDVRLLDIQNAEIVYLAGNAEVLNMTGFNLKVKDFSPKSSGNISLRSDFKYRSGATSLKGKIASTFQLTSFYPKPYGKGTVDLTVDTGEYLDGNKPVSLNDIALAANLVYDKRTETFTIDTIGKSLEFGPVKAAAKAVMTGAMPWSLNVSISAMDFAKVFGVLRPLLADDMKGWTMKGKGGVETRLQGTYANKQLAFNGTVALTFKDTGASSADSSISAQGVSGTVVLKLNYFAPEQKLAFNLYAVQQNGEQLWKEYYNNFNGQQASVKAEGAFFLTDDLSFSFSSWLDIFQTGDYSLSMSGNKRDWVLKAAAANVSHQKVIEKMLKEYLSGNTSGLRGFSATGSSSLETVISRDAGVTIVSGVYRMSDTAVIAPGVDLSVRSISADLPFNFVHPSLAGQTQVSDTRGNIHFTDIQRKRFSLGDLSIPVIIARNKLEVPERVVIPFFSGNIQVYDVLVDDLLSSDMQVRFGLKVENINLERLTEKLLEVELPGAINADFGVMTYQNKRVKSEGEAVIEVFGGEIRATNFFGQDIMLPSRKLGGDIVFKDINLEEVTRKIAIGKMSGIIRGSLKSFVMEYDQPASFVLEVESEERSGISQRISAEAINNISILGTGIGSGLGKGIMKLFNDFPYSRIGFRCVLNNDRFAVNGTIIEGGREYLVRRGFFRGVDVINQNKHNVISFRDMEERIKRILRQSGSKSGGMLIQ